VTKASDSPNTVLALMSGTRRNPRTSFGSHRAGTNRTSRVIRDAAVNAGRAPSAPPRSSARARSGQAWNSSVCL
jgi:hypothetical protein